LASTRISPIINAPRERVYGALLDPTAVARWKVPGGMRTGRRGNEVGWREALARLAALVE
jgi:uncharacterized protein YndB with AHSA1/START domain